MESIKCIDRKNKFCFVCGRYICQVKGQIKTKINPNTKVCLAFEKFYGLKISNLFSNRLYNKKLLIVIV